jgi:3-phenylpropionate/trans-cinnamate dioxygenase ferredoxin subunit
MTQIKVASVEMIPIGSMKQFYVGDLEILVVNFSDQIYCLDARCTHAGAPLAEGTLNGWILTCPWHGSQFNVTNGKVLRGPAEKQLKAYPSFVRDGYVFIDV